MWALPLARQAIVAWEEGTADMPDSLENQTRYEWARIAMVRDDCKVKPTAALEIAVFRSGASFEPVQLSLLIQRFRVRM